MVRPIRCRDKDDLHLESDELSDPIPVGEGYRSDMSGESRLRRSTTESLDALLDHATERLITHSLDAISGLVTPSGLARSTRAVSVDTAYRLLESPERTIELLVERLMTPDFSSESLEWPTFDSVFDAVIDSYIERGSLDGIHAALRVLIANNFALPAVVVGRLVAAATSTASGSWEGEVRLRDERLATARRIREALLTMVRSLDDEFACLLQIALIELQRRPNGGRTVKQVAILLRAFIDGAVDRMLLDPESFTIDEVATTAIDLGYALTEDGLLPTPAASIDAPPDFPLDAVIIAADAAWRSGTGEGILEAVARHVGGSEAEISAVFHDDAALADAVLQTLVVGGPVVGSRQSRCAIVATALRRLAQTADSTPALLIAARGVSDSTLARFEDEISELAQLRSSRSPESGALAARLIASACEGTSHWETTGFLIDLLRD